MKVIKPGWYHNYNDHIVRAVRRTNECEGCLYKNMTPCPNSIIKGSKTEPTNCIENDIIFVKPQ